VASYTQVLEAKSIDLRPQSANLRLEMGHGESDLMESGRSKTVAISRSAPAGSAWLTMTIDRGPENKSYSKWEIKLGLKVFFCHAYHSWEKGTVENIIKRIRRFIPKGSDIAKYSWRDIRRIEDWLNHRPMKCLQYLTPYEKMRQVIQNLESEP
jgi:IS30 family transposase